MAKTKSWSTFEIKSVDESERIIQGVASTPSTDRVGDIVEPLGAQYRLPLVVLAGHDSTRPVGSVIAARPDSSGIPCTLQIAKIDEPGILKDRLDEIWQSVKLKLIRGLSIGFVPLESTPTKTGLRYTRWSWLELSLVCIPCNEQATIVSVKSYDVDVRQTRPLRVVSYGKGLHIPGLKEAYQKDNAS